MRTSNYWASYNRNGYPEKLENAIQELYEWVDCPCDSNCECKKHNCEVHLVRKSDIPFKKHYEHFLNCYVDQKAHEAIRKERTKGRASNALTVTTQIKSNWNNYASAINKKSLICTEWTCEPYLTISKSFKPGLDNIYLSKWMALLAMGTYVAYDTGSVSLLKRDFNNHSDYYSLMYDIRKDLISHLRNNRKSINDFCLYDNPGEFYRSVPAGSRRPIGNIIDKLYLTL